MLKKRINIFLILALLFVIPQAEAQLFKRLKTGGATSGSSRIMRESTNIDIQTLTIDENKEIPKIDSPLARRKIREYMAAQQKSLQKLKQRGVSQVELEREGEIIKVEIPMHKLFYPNDTLMLENAHLLLRPFARYGSEQDMYHILIVTHSDNTGSIDYNLSLTSKRANTIYQWLKNNGAKTSNIVTYAMGGEEPLYKNISMENRQKNRRAEIYLIPGEEMIKLSLRGKLNIEK